MNYDIQIKINYILTIKNITVSTAAQQRFAADAVGAAPELGAILWRRGAPALVPVGGGRQRRR